MAPLGDWQGTNVSLRETLARRAFADVNASVSLQLVRDRFIAGQAEYSLR